MPLSPGQSQVAASTARFRTVIAGRRWGKTYLSIRELARFARQPGRRCWYIAPTYRMAKQIVWDELKYKLTDLRWVDRVNESDLTVRLINGSSISLRGADNPDSLRGVGLDFVVMDEFAWIDSDTWSQVLRPTLSDRNGHAMFISTPIGRNNWAYQQYIMPETTADWASWQYTSLSGGRIAPDEIAAARRDLDERTFRQEYEATFEEFSGRIFYAFGAENIRPAPELAATAEIMIGMDFNIDPMSAVIGTRGADDSLYIRDEIRMFGSNTDEMAAEIRSRYPTQRITVYPDPAARQRKTSAGGATDLTILRNAGFTVRAPNSHDPVRDGINSVNARFCNTAGERHLFVDPGCKYTRESLERHAYKEGTSQPDKDSGYDHMTDAVRYMVHFVWPLRVNHTARPAQRWQHGIT